MNKERDKIAQRLAGILQQLNAGETLTIKGLAEKYGVGERTIHRDLQERLASLPLEKNANKGYSYVLHPF